MSNRSTKTNASYLTTLRSLASHAKFRASQATANTAFIRSSQVFLLLALFSAPVTAQQEIGGVYCDTPIQALIVSVFGALVGLGLPVTMFYMGRSGLSYMRASGNPNQQNEARRDLILSGTGFGVILLAVVAPELVSKFAGEAGVTFSNCVNPLS